MLDETVLRGSRLALASLIATALASQLLIGLTNDLTVTNFLSFFTVLSNTLAIVLLVLLAARPGRAAHVGFAVFRGAVTIYMSVAGLVWAVILLPAATDVAVPEPWIDWTIHVVGPILILADWFAHPPPVALKKSVFGVWLIFPALYVTYSLIRGALVDWYPYPFLNPSEQGGYLGVTLWSLMVVAVILGFGYLYYWSANRRANPAS